ncbi:hypothetical protein, variant [Sphaeroforma arctica JP610]|uniref:Cdc23 domain-containing protein n=1 Tax=Sphaeroforma arctica JP610 TaxID=667725 RepID=A0A0L0G5X6_9EUKA|nr:hypothetical protein, variant [Sphaeroforma arctica JP610]KNC84430.1 hypothetical protein, variant [Sphaeroforma arctica JP610]|eukprot:XP_014158332.1 hypothetical protein, variant [Sphaeroforma arctica JP610]
MFGNHDSQVTATQLKNAAQSSLDAYNYENAIFLCERSLAEQDSEQTRCLLAKCHFLNRNLTAAYGVLDNPEPQTVNGLWLKARVCWDMDKWHEAEEKLLCVLALLNEPEGSINDTAGAPVVPKSEVLWLLGEVTNRTNRVQKAIKAYSEALEFNPYMWKCCERLADLGAWQCIEGKFSDSAAQHYYAKRLKTDEPAPKARAPLTSKTTASINTTPSNIYTTPPNVHTSANNAAENLFRNDRSCQRSSRKGAPFTGDNATSKSISYIMKIFRTLADGYSQVSKCSCKEGIVILRSLPKIQVNTAWVQRLIAKCYYERGEYVVSGQTYEYARRLAPYVHDGMDLYSTVLWQLRATKELSGLSHQLTADNKHSAIAWCVVGNAFSLQKDHESAQVFFERAIQLDPHYMYAYTLLGMEYEAIDAFDKAKACYLKAARISPRYYNVWNALGQTFLREESYARATSCFVKAHELNANSSIIACNLGNIPRTRWRHTTRAKCSTSWGDVRRHWCCCWT